MKQYVDIVKDILANGQWKENRTGIKTKTTFCQIFRHNMSDGFPMLTLKRLPYKTMAVELEGFIKGVTSKKWYQERGCKIWNEWANPVKAPYGHDEDSLLRMKEENDLGYIYGYSWRNFASAVKRIVKINKPKNPYYTNANIPKNPDNCGIATVGNPIQCLDRDIENILYQNWYDMINRCYNPNSSQYKYYGQKGVRVHDRWLIYENYRKDIEKLPRWQDKMRYPKEYVLDKDYLGYHYYGPNTCVFLHYKENILYNNSKLYIVYDKNNDTSFEFLTKIEIGEFLDCSRRSVDTYLNKEKLFDDRFKIYSVEDENLYRYELPIDQLSSALETLQGNPNDRRMVVSAWEPSNFRESALMPCHYAFTLVHIDGVLNLCWKQRSVDVGLGLPFNIASYALLLTLICEQVNMIPGELVGVLEDCHIYENHIDGMVDMLKRESRPLPTIEIIKNQNPWTIFDWTYLDFIVHNYDPHPLIKLDVAV